MPSEERDGATEPPREQRSTTASLGAFAAVAFTSSVAWWTALSAIGGRGAGAWPNIILSGLGAELRFLLFLAGRLRVRGEVSPKEHEV